MKAFPISDLFKQADNLTVYAKANGYRGRRQVLVLDGKVISHRSMNWFDFCVALRASARRRLNAIARQPAALA